MKTLFVLRHAKSSWKVAGLADHDRPLNARGRTAAPRMGRLLDDQGMHPDRILCSTALRARETVERVVRAGEIRCDIDHVDRMYGASAHELVDVLRETPDDAHRVMMVGHNPGLEELVERLTGEDVTLPTGALVHITLHIDAWSEASLNRLATLVETWRPRELD